jgi:hypothetical protein
LFNGLSFFASIYYYVIRFIGSLWAPIKVITATE